MKEVDNGRRIGSVRWDANESNVGSVPNGQLSRKASYAKKRHSAQGTVETEIRASLIYTESMVTCPQMADLTTSAGG